MIHSCLFFSSYFGVIDARAEFDADEDRADFTGGSLMYTNALFRPERECSITKLEGLGLRSVSIRH